MAKGNSNSFLFLLISGAIGYYFWTHPQTVASIVPPAPASGTNTGTVTKVSDGVTSPFTSPTDGYVAAGGMLQHLKDTGALADSAYAQENVNEAAATQQITHPFANDPTSIPGDYPGATFITGGLSGISGVNFDPSNPYDTGFNPTGPIFPTPYLDIGQLINIGGGGNPGRKALAL